MLAIPLGLPILMTYFKIILHVFATPHTCYFPISSYSTRTTTLSMRMMYSKAHRVYMFITWKRLYMDSGSLGKCRGVCEWYVSMTYTWYPPLQPTYCANFVVLVSQLTYPPPPKRIYVLLHEVYKLLQLKGLQMISLLTLQKNPLHISKFPLL